MKKQTKASGPAMFNTFRPKPDGIYAQLKETISITLNVKHYHAQDYALLYAILETDSGLEMHDTGPAMFNFWIEQATDQLDVPDALWFMRELQTKINAGITQLESLTPGEE